MEGGVWWCVSLWKGWVRLYWRVVLHYLASVFFLLIFPRLLYFSLPNSFSFPSSSNVYFFTVFLLLLIFLISHLIYTSSSSSSSFSYANIENSTYFFPSSVPVASVCYPLFLCPSYELPLRVSGYTQDIQQFRSCCWLFELVIIDISLFVC